MKTIQVKEQKIRFATFEKRYKPIQNPINDDAPYGGWMFDTDEKEHTYLRKLAEKSKIDGKNGYHIWTIVDGENNRQYIINGWHYVNRVGYLFTEIPWVEGEEIVSSM